MASRARAKKVQALLASAKGEMRLTDEMRDALGFTLNQKAVLVPLKLIDGFNKQFKKYA